VRSLIDAGYLVESRILAPAEHQDALAQDPLDAYQRYMPDGRAILFAESVEQAVELAERFSRAGVRAEVVSAVSDDRSGAQARFLRGETRVLTNYGIFKEGTDLPPTDTIIHVARCNSLPEWLQRNGRGLRPAPGKTGLTVLDLHGDVRDYGLLDDEHEWSLDGPGRLREGAPGLVQCGSCFSWGRGGRRCPCGATLPEAPARELRVDPAELEEVRRAQAAAEPEAERRRLVAGWAAMAVRVEAKRGVAAARAIVRGQYDRRYSEEIPRAWLEDELAAARLRLAHEAEEREAARAPLFARRT
jgi:superfamily II DNA or RNA helicase